jgi:hypothetical protein
MFLRLTFAAVIAFFIAEVLIFAQEHPEHPAAKGRQHCKTSKHS